MGEDVGCWTAAFEGPPRLPRFLRMTRFLSFCVTVFHSSADSMIWRGLRYIKVLQQTGSRQVFDTLLCSCHAWRLAVVFAMVRGEEARGRVE